MEVGEALTLAPLHAHAAMAAAAGAIGGGELRLIIIPGG